jgi:hypothetical protein
LLQFAAEVDAGHTSSFKFLVSSFKFGIGSRD